MANAIAQVKPVVPGVDALEFVAGLINATLANGDFVPAEEARRYDELMRSEHPDLHAEFLASNSYRLYYELLSSAYRGSRQSARHHSAAASFGELKSADTEELSVFRRWRCRVDAENTQRAIGLMTGADHLFVADEFRAAKEQSAMLEAFHRALARKVGKRRTEEVMGEEEFIRLYRSLTV